MENKVPNLINKDEIEQFWNQGALLVPQVFSPDEIAVWRQAIEVSLPSWRSQGLLIETSVGGRVKTDMLSQSLLLKILIEPRIVSLARTLLGTEPVYFGDSTFAYGPTGRGWHRDNRTSDRNIFTHADWQGHYPLIRVGLYLQDHKTHSGGLGVRLGSHLPSLKHPLINSKIVPRRLRSFFANHTGRSVHMDSCVGDVVIWTLRTLHSADAVRLKYFPQLRLAPFIENRLPHWARVANDGTRMACFMTFAAPSAHLDRYMTYLLDRDYMIDMWKHSVWDETVLNAAHVAGVKVIKDKVDALMSLHLRSA